MEKKSHYKIKTAKESPYQILIMSQKRTANEQM